MHSMLLTAALVAGFTVSIPTTDPVQGPAQDAAREKVEAKIRRHLDRQEARRADADHLVILAAVGNYVDAFYQERPELLDKSVRAELVKFGYMRAEGDGYTGSPMTLAELKGIAGAYKSYDDLSDPPLREIAVLDRLDKTAVARLHANWGIDYLHLAKLDGEWWVMQVLWQTAPASDGKSAEAAAVRAADRKAIERAVADYVESAYLVKPENVDKSVSRELAKIGFTKRADQTEWKRHDMTFDGLRELVSNWNVDGHIPKDARKEIEVLDQLDKIASAKAAADWGIDYFQLEKDDAGVWKIRHVIWQSHPIAVEAPADESASSDK